MNGDNLVFFGFYLVGVVIEKEIDVWFGMNNFFF